MGPAQLFRASGARYVALTSLTCSCILHATYPCRRTFHDSASTSTEWPKQSWAQTYAQRLRGNFVKPHPAETNTKKGDADIIDQANDLEKYAPSFEDDDDNAWETFSRNFDNVREGFARVKWSTLPDRIAEFLLPAWAQQLPGFVQKLQFELSMDPGSLADDIWQEAHDPDINPEILWSASVRVGNTLNQEELRFRQKRKEYMKSAFAKYIGVDEKDINTADIPTIAMCGSGGGLRAMVAGTSSYLCTQEAGLFDCVTYTAGVSGSCWLQTLFFSSVGRQNHHALLDHIKSRIGTHIAYPPTALKLMTSAPTNKFILSGFVEKLKGDPGATFGLVDIYSLLLAARLMVPKGDLDVRDTDLKLSNQREHLENGQYPMPIYTAVRHEIPVEEQAKKDAPSTPAQEAEVKEKARKEAWFQWFELTPWEVWCEEFGAGIPSWSLGRPFENGRNKLLDTGIALPEIRQSLLLGIYGSAFCATLSHYYKEIKPLLAGMAGFNNLDGLLEGKQEDLVKVHPIEPATIPNFVWGMKDKLPDTCPESVFKDDHLQLMDAGMSNNLPIYPLLRPGRDVDILIAFDASADIQKENWLSVVDGYARQRGIKSWPLGTGWPTSTSSAKENAKELADAQAEIKSSQVASEKIAEAREAQRGRHDGPKENIQQGSDAGGQTKKPSSDNNKSNGEENEKGDYNKVGKEEKQNSKTTGESPTTQRQPDKSSDLTYCNIWVGVSSERTSTDEPPPSKRLSWDNEKDSTFHLMSPDASLTVIYFPLLPNAAVPSVDPDKTDFLSTWNFIYTPSQVENVVDLARQNFREGEDATKRTVRAVYERKKWLRRQKEDRDNELWWRKRIRKDGDSFVGGGGN